MSASHSPIPFKIENFRPDDGPTREGFNRRDATLLGVRTFVLTQVAVLVAGVALLVAATGAQFQPDAYLEAFFVAAFITLPPMVLIGLWITPSVYSLLNGERKFHPISYGIWLAMSILISPIFIGFALSYRARETAVQKNEVPRLGWWALFFLVCLAIQGFFSHLVTRNLHMPLALSAIYGVFIADTLAVRAMAIRFQDDDWAGEKRKRFQFTLSTLLAVVLGFGGYVSGLILIFD